MLRLSNSGSSSSSRTSSGLASPGLRQQCMIVLVAAYSSPLEKTFKYVLERMGRTTSSLVIVSCLTLVRNAVDGMELPVASVERKWREGALQHQFKALSFCVKNVLHLFEERQVHVQVLVKTGETNEVIANQVAQKYRPNWIIVDSSLLSGRQGKQFQQRLKDNADLTSNLAFVPGGSREPSFKVSGAFFEEPVVTSMEVTATSERTVEEYTQHVNTVACGVFTCFQGSSSSSRRSVSRDEERTSFQR